MIMVLGSTKMIGTVFLKTLLSENLVSTVLGIFMLSNKLKDYMLMCFLNPIGS